MTDKALKLAVASLALTTTIGISLHDTHIDKVTIGVVTQKDSQQNHEISQRAHTHSEEIQVSKHGQPNKSSAPDPRDKLKKNKMNSKNNRNRNPSRYTFA